MRAQYRIQRRPDICSLDFPSSVHPVLKRVYMKRKLSHPQEVETSLDKLYRADSLSGLQAAVALLVEALKQQQKILIVGDFDADGATSTALAIRALKAMGASQVQYLVPNRFEYGYGLTPEIVTVAATLSPDILITVDNGISSIEGVDAAKAQGMQVIITDHHLPGQALPAADAIVNPNLQDDDFPSKCLAGVGVIFYVLLSLRAQLREQGWFTAHNIKEPNMARYLDLVALGTVADVVPLDHNNRILVEQGLKRIRAQQCIAGIEALLKVGKRKLPNAVASDLAFAVAPRLNAAGRLEDMSVGIECLLSDDPSRSQQLAEQLDTLNQQRKDIEQNMQDQALVIIDTWAEANKTADIPAGLCLYDASWHQGVVGIVAARIKEQVHRPVIAFAQVDDNEIKGSARSIPGIHIRDVLDAVATQHPGLVTKFGGHAMAAGLSLPLENFTAFQAAFAAQVAEQLAEQPAEAVVLSDGELGQAELVIGTAEALRQAGPWGQGFPEPLFDGIFEVCEKRIVGQSHLKMLLKLPGTEQTFDAIAFNQTGEMLEGAVPRVHVAYKLDVNEFRGFRNVQLNVHYLEPIA